MTLLELRGAGYTVGGEREPAGRGGGGRVVLVRCTCLTWHWVRKSRLAAKVAAGRRWRCRRCAAAARGADAAGVRP